MNKPELRKIVYVDFEEAVCFIATKYELNEYNIQQELVAGLELGAMTIFTVNDLAYEYVELFIREFGIDAKYIWEW